MTAIPKWQTSREAGAQRQGSLWDSLATEGASHEEAFESDPSATASAEVNPAYWASHAELSLHSCV